MSHYLIRFREESVPGQCLTGECFYSLAIPRVYKEWWNLEEEYFYSLPLHTNVIFTLRAANFRPLPPKLKPIIVPSTGLEPARHY